MKLSRLVTKTPEIKSLKGMKCLTLRQPWAWLVAMGFKDIENRSWETKYRGPLLIHAGKAKMNLEERRWIENLLKKNDEAPIEMTYGAIVGMVEVTDCVKKHKSQWFTGPNGFVLAKPKCFKTSIPYKGRLGFFDFTVGKK